MRLISPFKYLNLGNLCNKLYGSRNPWIKAGLASNHPSNSLGKWCFISETADLEVLVPKVGALPLWDIASVSLNPKQWLSLTYLELTVPKDQQSRKGVTNLGEVIHCDHQERICLAPLWCLWLLNTPLPNFDGKWTSTIGILRRRWWIGV